MARRYRRKPTRPPREVAQTAAMEARDQIRAKVQRMESEMGELNQRVLVADLEVEKLLHEKILLALELREARGRIDLLEGRKAIRPEILFCVNNRAKAVPPYGGNRKRLAG